MGEKGEGSGGGGGGKWGGEGGGNLEWGTPCPPPHKGVREHIQAAILKRDEIKDNNKLRSFEHPFFSLPFVL